MRGVVLDRQDAQGHSVFRDRGVHLTVASEFPHQVGANVQSVLLRQRNGQGNQAHLHRFGDHGVLGTAFGGQVGGEYFGYVGGHLHIAQHNGIQGTIESTVLAVVQGGYQCAVAQADDQLAAQFQDPAGGGHGLTRTQGEQAGETVKIQRQSADDATAQHPAYLP